MSLALFKKLLFPQPKQQTYKKIGTSSLRTSLSSQMDQHFIGSVLQSDTDTLLPESYETQSWASSPTMSSASSDVEAQQLRDEFSEKLPPSARSEPSRFKVDARVISDAIIGLSDGLTVPFALTAGLSAIGSTKVVVYGGMAELIAGAISMGLGGYLGAKSERYASSILSLPCPELI